jgi:type IV pilus assembly protein PilN
MIKVNLLVEKKVAKVKKASGRKTGGTNAGQNALLSLLIIGGMVLAFGWNWKVDGEIDDLQVKIEEQDKELERLAEIRRKGEEYKAQKELLARKIDLITTLKKKQARPVRIMDQLSRQLPDFVFLDSMSATNNKIAISGRATNYQAVSKFYRNLSESGMFGGVTLGRTYEVNDGVAFSLSADFTALNAAAPAEAPAEEPKS